MIDEIINYNKGFIEQKRYKPFETSKYPNKKLAILTCMDTRLTELLPAALGIKNGDAKIIKNAGGVVDHPYGSVVRSLLVGILSLDVEEIMIIGHTDCGVQGMDGKSMLGKLEQRNIPREHIELIEKSGIDLEKWLGGFDSAEESVKSTVESLKEHPLMPKDIVIRGFMMDSVTGELNIL
ncbi:beta-class carbonic anhydrase [Lachnospiraceae bacterium LCP25S3_G4]